MPLIQLETTIRSNIEICFDLSRSIDLHKMSMSQTQEKAIDGTTSGLINVNEFVTWEATHFGITQHLSSRITVFDFPKHFRDEQISGPFKLIVHDHYFSQNGECVIMKDDFRFESPLGALGRIANPVLKPYLTKLLTARNRVIKYYAESGEWMKILPSNYSSSANVST